MTAPFGASEWAVTASNSAGGAGRIYHVLAVDRYDDPQPGTVSISGMENTTRMDTEADAICFLVAVAAAGELAPGSLLVAFADHAGHSCGAIAVDDVPADPPQHSRVRALAPLLRGLAAADRCAGVLLAIARQGDPRAQGGDLAWHDAFAGTSRVAGLHCHGTYVVTPSGIRRVRPGRRTVTA